jgi:hypothetical protein
MFQDRKVRRMNTGLEHPNHWSILSLVLGYVLVAYSVWPQVALSGDQSTIVLATTTASLALWTNSSNP